eukprot:GEMP01041118.1.p1 GENE.GEMP01041118.1~~GEMP01041118.1.p1  ORF type:complete len:397 (+),score=102.06 GEMP01041118.1:92-1282(+)
MLALVSFGIVALAKQSECTMDKECISHRSGPKCNTNLGVCAGEECTADADCNPERPTCVTAYKRCAKTVECTSDKDCSGFKPVCNVVLQICQGTQGACNDDPTAIIGGRNCSAWGGDVCSLGSELYNLTKAEEIELKTKCQESCNIPCGPLPKKAVEWEKKKGIQVYDDGRSIIKSDQANDAYDAYAISGAAVAVEARIGGTKGYAAFGLCKTQDINEHTNDPMVPSCDYNVEVCITCDIAYIYIKYQKDVLMQALFPQGTYAKLVKSKSGQISVYYDRELKFTFPEEYTGTLYAIVQPYGHEGALTGVQVKLDPSASSLFKEAVFTCGIVFVLVTLLFTCFMMVKASKKNQQQSAETSSADQATPAGNDAEPQERQSQPVSSRNLQDREGEHTKE